MFRKKLRQLWNGLSRLFRREQPPQPQPPQPQPPPQVPEFTKFIFPVLRSVMPSLIAHEVVSVQPMTAPIGAMFYMDYIYRQGNSPLEQWQRYIVWQEWAFKFSDCRGPREELEVLEDPLFGEDGEAAVTVTVIDPVTDLVTDLKGEDISPPTTPPLS